MSNELQAQYAPGATLTARVMDGTTVVVNSVALTETATAGYYVGSMPGGIAAGVYTVLLLASGSVVGSGNGPFRWDGAAEVLPAVPGNVPTTSAIATAVRVSIDAAPVDSNIVQVNDTPITGAGVPGNLWRPA